MKRLLWVGDAGVPSGFARATHNILDHLDYRASAGGQWDCTVLAINYRGDPHQYPYDLWTCPPGGDAIGIGRLIFMCDVCRPDVIVFQNDPWNFKPYFEQIRAKKPDGTYHFPDYAKIPLVGVVAVDGKNCAGGYELNELSHAIFWTQFGLDEARDGGYTKPASVIALGVDRQVYFPEDKDEAREAAGLGVLKGKFIVGNVNRNQPRKRFDLAIRYFAKWIQSKKIDDAYLYLHVAPTGDTGITVRQLTSYYGVLNRVVLNEPSTWYGETEHVMRRTYNCFDVAINTGQGEGFGLTTLEAMACARPPVVGDWSALGEWAKGAVWLVPCTSTAVGPPWVNVIGGVPDEAQFISALHRLYDDPRALAQNGQAALERACDPRFDWRTIGDAYDATLQGVLAREVEA